MRKIRNLILSGLILVTLIISAACESERSYDHLPEYCRTYSGFTSVASSDMYTFINEELNDLGISQLDRYTYFDAIEAVNNLQLDYDFPYSDTSNYVDLNGLQCFQNITSISLTGSAFKDISPISALKNVEVVSIVDTRVSSIESFVNLSKVYSLSLVNNQSLQSTDGIGEMLKLEELDLSNNALQDISALTNLVNLRSLTLDNNELSADGLNGVSALTKLETLSVKNNYIEDISEIKATDNTQFQVLSTLDLSGNNISTIPDGSLSGLSSLSYLDISGNPLNAALDLAGLSGTDAPLETLVINNTGITEINNLSLSSLKYLDLSKNNIADISSITDGLTQGNTVDNNVLETLILNENPLTNFDDVSGLSRLVSLETLRLSKTGITNAGFGELMSATTLITLDLSENTSITAIPEDFKDLINLMVIDLSDCSITDTSNLNSNPSVTSIDLSGNKITNLKGIYDLPNLSTLILLSEDYLYSLNNLDEDHDSEIYTYNENIIDTIEDSFVNTPRLNFNIKNHLGLNNLSPVIEYGSTLSILGNSFSGDSSYYQNLDFSMGSGYVDSLGNNLNPVDGYKNNAGDYAYFGVSIIEVSADAFNSTTIRKISFNGQSNLTNIDFVKNLGNINEIQMYGVNITDFTQLDATLNTNLSSLAILYLTNASSTDIAVFTGLNGFTNLTDLFMNNYNINSYDNAFNDLSGLTYFTNAIFETSYTSAGYISDSFNNLSAGTTTLGFLKSISSIDNSFNDSANLCGIAFVNLMSDISTISSSFNNIVFTAGTDPATANDCSDSISLSGYGIDDIVDSFMNSTFTSLNLGGNTLSLTITDNLSFTDTTVTTLSLSNSGLIDSELVILANFTSIEELYLSNNAITDTSYLPLMDNLTILDVSNNSITALEDISATEFPAIAEVYVDGNPIVSITNSFNDFTFLTDYDISNLSDLTTITGSFNNLSALTSFTMSGSGNGSSGIVITNSLQGNSGLTLLDLSNSLIANYDFMTNISTITDLNISGLGLSVDNLSYFSTVFNTVTTLDISNNSVNSLYEFEQFTVLNNLDVTSNSITSITDFNHLTLADLYIDLSNITTIENSYNDAAIHNFNDEEINISDFNSTSLTISNSFNHASVIAFNLSDSMSYTISNSFNNVSILVLGNSSYTTPSGNSFDFINNSITKLSSLFVYGNIANFSCSNLSSLSEVLLYNSSTQDISNSFNNCTKSFDLYIYSGDSINNSFNGQNISVYNDFTNSTIATSEGIGSSSSDLTELSVTDSFDTTTSLSLASVGDFSGVTFNNSFASVGTLVLPSLSEGLTISSNAFDSTTTVILSGSDLTTYSFIDNFNSVSMLLLTNTSSDYVTSTFDYSRIANINLSNSNISTIDGLLPSTTSTCSLVNLDFSGMNIDTYINSFNNCDTLATLNGSTFEIPVLSGSTISSSFNNLSVSELTFSDNANVSSISGSFKELTSLSNFSLSGFTIISTIDNNSFENSIVKEICFDEMTGLDSSSTVLSDVVASSVTRINDDSREYVDSLSNLDAYTSLTHLELMNYTPINNFSFISSIASNLTTFKSNSLYSQDLSYFDTELCNYGFKGNALLVNLRKADVTALTTCDNIVSSSSASGDVYVAVDTITISVDNSTIEATPDNGAYNGGTSTISYTVSPTTSSYYWNPTYSYTSDGNHTHETTSYENESTFISNAQFNYTVNILLDSKSDSLDISVEDNYNPYIVIDPSSTTMDYKDGTNLLTETGFSCLDDISSNINLGYILVSKSITDGYADTLSVGQEDFSTDLLFVGTYTIRYFCHDNNGNRYEDTNTYTVTVEDNTAPVITLTGEGLSSGNPKEVEARSSFLASVFDYNSYSCSDNYHSDRGDCNVTVNDLDDLQNNTNVVGTYRIEYTFTDIGGNTTIEHRYIEIVDTTAATITIMGTGIITLQVDEDSYEEYGATCSDIVDTDCIVTTEIFKVQENGNDITASSVASIDHTLRANYEVRYSYTDSSGNSNTETRYVYVTDTVDPEITLTGSNTITLDVFGTYTELGAICSDNYDDDKNATVTGIVNTSLVGSYTITYSCTDSSGNSASEVTRTVDVVDTTNPVITLTGLSSITLEVHDTYYEEGAICTDNYDSNKAATVTGTVNTSVLGTYTLYYNCSDSSNNDATQVTRTVEIVDTTAPEIYLTGLSTITLEVGSTFNDEGATCADNYDSDKDVTATGTVNTSVLGTYTLYYNCSDSSNNDATQVTRTVEIVDRTAPVASLTGNSTVTINLGESYLEQGATCSDNYDSSLTPSLSGNVEDNTIGQYTITYTCTDSSGNSHEVSRTINVVDNTTPVVSTTSSTTSFSSGTTAPDWTSYFTILDNNSTIDVTSGMLSWDTPINMNQAGEYILTCTYTDQGGNTDSNSVTITIS